MSDGAQEDRYEVFFAGEALKELKKVGPSQAKRVLKDVKKKLPLAPEGYGEPLGKELSGYRRLVVGGIRVIYKVDTDRVWVLVLAVGKRLEGNIDNIYDWLTSEKLAQRLLDVVDETKAIQQRLRT